MKSAIQPNGADPCNHPHRYAVIVHEDRPTELRAKRFWNRLVHNMGRQAWCAASYYHLEEIKRLLGLEQGRVANVVVISVHDFADFLLSATIWLDDWMTRNSHAPRALVVLHDGRCDSPLFNVLREVVRITGVTLFTHGRKATGKSTAETGNGLPAAEDARQMA
jgi:hypothetical protein